ncbi:MAG TPA: DUF362 domain-containing protein [Labilithrix sp.]|nr:DUF362 domain-containing protein [Labilithrix sp.]
MGDQGHELVAPAVDASFVVREFEGELRALRDLCGGDAERERRALLLVTLEREQLVTVAYAGSALHGRVAALDAPEDVREIVRHALFWAARDEDMHTVYVRGILFRRGERALVLRTIAQQLGGFVAGWSSAVSQHVTWSKAPLSRLGALGISLAGLVAGKVPKSARATLGHQTFRQFCDFNAEAEKTAAMAWRRLAELVPEEASTYARVAADELKHSRVFAAFAEAFDDQDRMIEGKDARFLLQRLGEVDPVFVPRRYRDIDNPLGTGKSVFVRAAPPEAVDPVALLDQALVESGVMGRVSGRLGDRGRVAIKTDFMMSYDERDRTTAVDVELLRALCARLRAAGAKEISLVETGNLFDRHFANRTVKDVADYMKLHVPDVRLVDAATDLVPHRFARGLGQESVCATWKDADLRISFAKMRTHPAFLAHLSLSNMQTLGQRIDELLFADRVADGCTGLMMVLDGFPCHLAIVDATRDVADDVIGILGTSSPRHPGRLYVSEDALALDWVVLGHLGLMNLPRPAPAQAALDWFGDVRGRLVVDGVDEPITPFTTGHSDDLRILLTSLAFPVYAYFSAGGSFWVPKMDPVRFPLSEREGMLTYVARRLLRLVFHFGSPVKDWQ